jgi:ArsR family transcriptional regulator
MTVSLENSSPARLASNAVRLSRARRAAILKALADPRRLQLLERIARAASPLGCAEARTALAVSPATLSHHIKELESAGLVHVEREGKFIHLSLRPEVWSALVASLASLGQSRSATP